DTALPFPKLQPAGLPLVNASHADDAYGAALKLHPEKAQGLPALIFSIKQVLLSTKKTSGNCEHKGNGEFSTRITQDAGRICNMYIMVLCGFQINIIVSYRMVSNNLQPFAGS